MVAAYDARTKIVDRHLLRVFASLALIAAFLRWIDTESGALFGVLAKDIVTAAAIWFYSRFFDYRILGD